jgi:hypothetical protein
VRDWRPLSGAGQPGWSRRQAKAGQTGQTGGGSAHQAVMWHKVQQRAEHADRTHEGLRPNRFMATSNKCEAATESCQSS